MWWGFALAWIKGHSLRDWIVCIALVCLLLFVWFWNGHERGIGENRCEDRHEKASVAAQDKADKVAVDGNSKVEADIRQISAPLPNLLEAYQDKTKPADCAPYVRPTRKKP